VERIEEGRVLKQASECEFIEVRTGPCTEEEDKEENYRPAMKWNITHGLVYCPHSQAVISRNPIRLNAFCNSLFLVVNNY
jgi:hypothetical protein